MKPESYPFLRIANKYNVDYGAVLIYADRGGNLEQFKRASAKLHNSCHEWNFLISEINRARSIQDRIKNGEIDWQTGEPR